jgi:competence protein ComEA
MRKMKTSILRSYLKPILNTKLLIQLTFIFGLLFNTLSLHASEETASKNPESVIATETNRVNINTADAELISKSLKGIGLKKATAIVEYREAYGAFQSIEELTAVSGIGEKTIQKNSNLIAIK